ncbi:MAG: hypothetical protein IJI33_03500 [Solobacterium sp.]|nr:hypothetical protein [Solobacterium sp.]MBQ6532042.1 hypothetical protein [Solobacterium sp.]
MPTDKHTDQHRPESISSVYPPRKQVFLGRLLSDIFLLVFCAVWFSWFIPTAAGIFAEVNETAGSFVHVCFAAAVSGLSIFFLILVIRDIRRVYRIIRNME